MTEPIKRAHPRVIVFTTPTCGFCNATKNYLLVNLLLTA